MKKQELINMVSAARGGTPLCRIARLKAVGQNPRREIAYCPFPTDDAAALLKAFRAAPQFLRIDAEEVLRRAQHGVRAVLVSESPYDARQAALYLAAMSAQLRRGAGHAPADDSMDDVDGLDLDELFETEPEEREMKNALLVVSASLLDPDIASAGQDESSASAMAMMEKKQLDLSSFPAPALLTHADSGPVLSDAVIDRLEFLCGTERDVFVSLRRSQIDLELINELQFKHRFLLLHILPPSNEYLSAVLRAAVSEQRLSLSAGADPVAVISHLRRLRGRRFDETDLYDAAAYAAQHANGISLTTADLLYRPYSPKEAGRRAMDELNAMTGLENVKATLRRQLAVSVLNARRDRDMIPCRNLAFAGPPGTGKSVTARLFAEILREEGCGTGRFIEAGREQLIGKYTGHTSPKIARLFEKVRGGVLFIDEAGALIPDGRDSYAEEAVNALVRHMELQPETVVIFATYTDEMKWLLDSNPGLSSRIARVLEFEGYTDEQLWSILDTLTAKEGFALPADAHDGCLSFFRALRERRGESFGNGREARRLRDAAVEELALRAMDGAEPIALTAADFDAAARRLLEQEPGDGDMPRIGF